MESFSFPLKNNVSPAVSNTPLLMMMSPLFKEETSITVTSEKIYIYPNLFFYLKTGSFYSSIEKYCYNIYKKVLALEKSV